MSVKKVVIAAAGQGTRMLELSKEKSKHLIEVNNRPFLAYLTDSLLLAGYKEIILVVGFKVELMNDFVKNYLPPEGIEKSDFKITLVNQSDIIGPKEKEYGTACPIKCVKDIVGDESFLYVYGDNLFSVEDLKSMNIDDEFCYIAGLKQEHPEKYGVLIPFNVAQGEEVGDEFLEKIIEKPTEFVGDLVNAGLYKFTKDIFEKVFKVEKSLRGEYEVTDAISFLAEEKKVKIKKIKDCWHDFGNPGDIQKISDFLAKSQNTR
jgi:UDP-N-acetylglucosamine diphosphorylase / glucose-1-phosphate thymidylyltransferase / UDP-N-acetylgalactosamine diphosphorylase / glucosamine-1-phosphate N-acetyltransferase / galactosamine-1-phosphate N-acetyltransferase